MLCLWHPALFLELRRLWDIYPYTSDTGPCNEGTALPSAAQFSFQLPCPSGREGEGTPCWAYFPISFHLTLETRMRTELG